MPDRVAGGVAAAAGVRRRRRRRIHRGGAGAHGVEAFGLWCAAGDLPRRERGLEPLGEQVVLEEVERPLLLLLLVRRPDEIDHLDLDRAVLHELLERRVDAGPDEVDLRFQARGELVVDPFEIRLDLHVQGRSHPGVLEIVDDPHGLGSLLEGLLEDDGAFLGERQREGGVVISGQ